MRANAQYKKTGRGFGTRRSKVSNNRKSNATGMAARAFSRRFLLRSSAVAAAGVATAQWIVKSAFSSSGELNFMGWAGYDFKPVWTAFTAKTGIKVNFTEQPDQDVMAAQAKAGGAEGAFDISEPAVDRVQNWVEQGFLQPWDQSKINWDGIEPGIAEGEATKLSLIDGKHYGSPSVWGTESLTFNTDDMKMEYGKASYGDLWGPDLAGKVTVRPHSGLVGIGLWMDREGKLPHPFRDSFKDDATMTANYDVVFKKALEVKGNVGQWWKDENTAQGAFRTNGCTAGQCWDTSAQALMKEGLPIGYLSPVEGALSWLQTFVLFKGAKNIEQADAWASWISTPEGSLAWANAYAGNPIAKGAADSAPDSQKKFLKTAFPGDALSKLWWWPAQPTWFVSKRNEYQDKWQAA
jgi:spermidine/putrescine transport system substrate-binding protein